MAIPIFGKITMKRFFILCALIFTLVVPNPLRATIIHVPADSSSIQAGINGAVDGDSVLVAPGLYYENINFFGKGILLASNFIFDGDTTTIHSTIINGSEPAHPDTSSVIILISGEDSTSIIKGFTITGGSGTVVPPQKIGGGGILCSNSSPRIAANIITQNSASWGGGGIYCKSSFALVENNVLTGNTSDNGGAILCQGGGSLIQTNVISNNVGNYWAGGIFCWVVSSTAKIRGNLIIGNSAGWGAGAIAIGEESSPTILNNVIIGNIAGSQGGGGIRLYWYSAPQIKNNLIVQNSADWGGGIASDSYSNPQVSFNDLWNNAGGNCSGCAGGVGDTTWGTNFNGTPCDSFYNIIRDPLFADTTDFKLLCNSPCIDAGDPSISIPSDSGGCRIDMGAHEYLYILGDATSDSAIDIGDVVFVINYLYRNGPPSCLYHAADTNCDGEVNLGDIVCLINYLFRGGELPC